MKLLTLWGLFLYTTLLCFEKKLLSQLEPMTFQLIEEMQFQKIVFPVQLHTFKLLCKTFRIQFRNISYTFCKLLSQSSLNWFLWQQTLKECFGEEFSTYLSFASRQKSPWCKINPYYLFPKWSELKYHRRFKSFCALYISLIYRFDIVFNIGSETR